jgi:hypothetical protein
MPVKLKLEGKPIDLINEVEYLTTHNTLTYGGVGALHGILEAG